MASSRVGTSLRTRRGPYLVFQVCVLFLLMNRRLSRLGSAATCPILCVAASHVCDAAIRPVRDRGKRPRGAVRAVENRWRPPEADLPPERSSDLVGARRAEIDLVLIAGIGER